MPQIKGWFKARKTLHNRRKVYYEDVYGHKNSEEDLEGVHILDSESDSESEIFRRQATARTSSHGDEQSVDSNKDNEPVIPAADRGNVIMIDDSDVDDTFIADLRKHAAQSVNDCDVQGDEIDMALLADIYLADEPPKIANNSSDEVLANGDLGARQFAEQSPLRPTKALKPESNDHVVVKTTKRTGRKNVRDAPTQPAKTTLETRFQRAHSWDPNQGSEYEYSDEGATNDPTDPDVEMETIRHDTESEDHDPADEDSSTDDALEDVIQDEDSHDEVRQRSESHDHDSGVIELEDFENADRTNNQMAERYVTIDHDRSDGHESDHDDIDHNGGFYTHPEPKEASSFQKHKRFGMFAASPAADAEPVAKRYMEPPQRLRVKTRRMEREQKKFREKKGRYDLRPRRT